MYITAEGGLYLIDTDDCTLCDGCSSCVTSLDPHCAYDFKQNKCVSISRLVLQSSHFVLIMYTF